VFLHLGLYLFADGILTDQVPVYEWDWIDPRDVAQLFLRALETPEAGGQRIIITAGLAVLQDLRMVRVSLMIPN
jgi:nucleoside-diphosphate-sugar epimerase